MLDPCRTHAQSVLTPKAVTGLEAEASAWRRGLHADLEKYHNEQMNEHFARTENVDEFGNVTRYHAVDFHPRVAKHRPFIDAFSVSEEAYTRRRFDFFLPRGLAEHEEVCSSPGFLGDPKFIGQKMHGDTYLACSMPVGPDCLVYSLGSNNQWSFEEAVLRSTDCSIHTFDCTSRPPPLTSNLTHSKRHAFHSWCVGSTTPKPTATIDRNTDAVQRWLRWSAEQSHQRASPPPPPRAFKNLSETKAYLAHAARPIALIKWDVEGFEYDIFRELLDGDIDALPREILFELHFRAHMGARTSWRLREKHAGELAVLAIDLYDMGYRVVKAKGNLGCASCYAYSLLRTRCPRERKGS